MSNEFPGWRDGSEAPGQPMSTSMDVAVTHTAMRPYASDLLLRHCHALGFSGNGRVPARIRLEEALGPDLARKLVASLTAASRR